MNTRERRARDKKYEVEKRKEKREKVINIRKNNSCSISTVRFQ
jgi:hypothetical protein